MYVAREADGGFTGSARRRRERRLRAYLRYARMSVAMALAESTHHSAQRPKKARAREEEREVHYTAAFRTTVPPPEPELFDLFEEPGGGRPDLLLEPQGQQLGVPRHFVEHLADLAPMVQILDIPVPQMGVELADILKCVDLQAPIEQVIDVPRISQDSIQPRSVLRRPQTAEQLVEVPTIVSFSSLQQLSDEQIVNIPVPGRGGGGRGGFQGSYPRQSSTAVVAEQIVEIPACGGPQGFPSDRVRCSVLWSNSLTFLFQLVEVFTEFALILGVQAHAQFCVMSVGMGIYALLHMMSKVRVPPGGRVRGCTRTRAHGLWRLMRPRSVRTRTSSTSSSTSVASHGYEDGSRLGQGLPIGS